MTLRLVTRREAMAMARAQAAMRTLAMQARLVEAVFLMRVALSPTLAVQVRVGN